MALREIVRKFVKEEVEPLANQIEETNTIPTHIVRNVKGNGLIWS